MNKTRTTIPVSENVNYETGMLVNELSNVNHNARFDGAVSRSVSASLPVPGIRYSVNPNRVCPNCMGPRWYRRIIGAGRTQCVDCKYIYQPTN